MIELEKKVAAPLFQQNQINTRFVDDTLLLAKEDGISYISEKFNAVHKNLKFIIERFDDDKVPFSDILIDKTETDLYYKPAHTGQYS